MLITGCTRRCCNVRSAPIPTCLLTPVFAPGGRFGAAASRSASVTRVTTDRNRDTAPARGGRFDADGDATRRTHLANERTYLAWWRTGIACMAGSLGVPALTSDSSGLAVVVGVIFGLLGIACFLYGWVRFRRGRRGRAARRVPCGPTTASSGCWRSSAWWSRCWSSQSCWPTPRRRRSCCRARARGRRDGARRRARAPSARCLCRSARGRRRCRDGSRARRPAR